MMKQQLPTLHSLKQEVHNKAHVFMNPDMIHTPLQEKDTTNKEAQTHMEIMHLHYALVVVQLRHTTAH